MSEIKDVNEIDESEILTPEQIAEIEAQKIKNCLAIMSKKSVDVL